LIGGASRPMCRPAVVWLMSSAHRSRRTRAMRARATTKGASMCWRRAREAQGDAFGLDRRSDAGTGARAGACRCSSARGAPPGRPAERRPVGVQLGSLAEWAAMRQLILRSTRCPSCGRSLGVSPLCGVPKASHRRPTVGDFSVRLGGLTR
jgi:hypothetical protein